MLLGVYRGANAQKKKPVKHASHGGGIVLSYKKPILKRVKSQNIVTYSRSNPVQPLRRGREIGVEAEFSVSVGFVPTAPAARFRRTSPIIHHCSPFSH